MMGGSGSEVRLALAQRFEGTGKGKEREYWIACVMLKYDTPFFDARLTTGIRIGGFGLWDLSSTTLVIKNRK